MKFFIASNNPQLLRENALANPYVDNLKIEYDHNPAVGLPERYNRFIAAHLDADDWLCFIHDDVWLFEPIRTDMPRDGLYGVVGAAKIAGKGELVGQVLMTEQDRPLGTPVDKWAPVVTCDPFLIVVHSELFRRYPALRFDERLRFHLFFEELSIRAWNSGLTTYALGIRCRHLSWGEQDDEFKRSWAYVTGKHGITRFISTVSRQSLDGLEAERWV